MQLDTIADNTILIRTDEIRRAYLRAYVEDVPSMTTPSSVPVWGLRFVRIKGVSHPYFRMGSTDGRSCRVSDHKGRGNPATRIHRSQVHQQAHRRGAYQTGLASRIDADADLRFERRGVREEDAKRRGPDTDHLAGRLTRIPKGPLAHCGPAVAIIGIFGAVGHHTDCFRNGIASEGLPGRPRRIPKSCVDPGQGTIPYLDLNP
jgi:hypothetical protein